MTLEEQIAALANKIDDYHEKDEKKSQGDRYQNLSWILYGFALATMSLALANSPPTSGLTLASVIVASVDAFLFLILGGVATYKLKKYRRWCEF